MMKRLFFPSISELDFLLSQRYITELLRWKIQHHPQTETSRNRHLLQVRHSVSYLLLIKRMDISAVKKKASEVPELQINKHRTARQRAAA